MRRGIEPHIPLLDREHQTKGFFTRADFAFDRQANVFVCPGGNSSEAQVREDGSAAEGAARLHAPDRARTAAAVPEMRRAR
jgi:hypothetical protein